MAKKVRNKKFNLTKQVIRYMQGTRISWSTPDPLGDINEVGRASITHANKLKSLMMPKLERLIKTSINELPYKWHIAIDMEFYHITTGTYLKGYELIAIGKLQGLNESYDTTIETLFSEANMEHYVSTHITATILKNSPIKEEDFA